MIPFQKLVYKVCKRAVFTIFFYIRKRFGNFRLPFPFVIKKGNF